MTTSFSMIRIDEKRQKKNKKIKREILSQFIDNLTFFIIIVVGFTSAFIFDITIKFIIINIALNCVIVVWNEIDFVCVWFKGIAFWSFMCGNCGWIRWCKCNAWASYRAKFAVFMYKKLLSCLFVIMWDKVGIIEI